ncbi:MAG TPA: zinc ribbon domain-containing protein [Solirubrobacteraceae bacterium]|nr:zinc ribbon domain-containing protein [Solirubrobacteraceae bacterium]
MGILRDTGDGDRNRADPAAVALDGAPAGSPADTLVLETAAVPPSSAGAAPAARAAGGSELERRRDALAAQVTELHWDLGGLAYEMAIRDHFRLDVLVRRAATLQERDAELAEVERLLRMEQDGVAGSCPECAAPHSRGALFCWQCGARLMQSLPSGAASMSE